MASFSGHDNKVYLVHKANKFLLPRINFIGARTSCNVELI